MTPSVYPAYSVAPSADHATDVQYGTCTQWATKISGVKPSVGASSQRKCCNIAVIPDGAPTRRQHCISLGSDNTQKCGDERRTVAFLEMPAAGNSGRSSSTMDLDSRSLQMRWQHLDRATLA